MIEDLVKQSRSYRRFDESVCLDRQQLEALVNLARYPLLQQIASH
jgi:nitroreductase